MHDLLTVGAPAPLQAAAAVAVGLALDADDYNHPAMDFRTRRDLLCGTLAEAGFAFTPPPGAYYVLAGCSGVKDAQDDVALAKWLASEVGVATVPGSS